MTRWCISPSYLNGYAPLFSSCAMDPGPRIVTCYTYGLEAGYSYSCPDSGFGDRSVIYIVYYSKHV